MGCRAAQVLKVWIRGKNTVVDFVGVALQDLTPVFIVRRDKPYQRSPGNNPLHFLRELALTGCLRTELEVQEGLFQALSVLRLDSYPPFK